MYFQKESFTCRKLGGFGCGKVKELYLNKEMMNHALSPIEM